METINLSVLRGPVSAPPEVRRLESGTRIATFSVRTAGPNGKGVSVPVTVWEPASWIETLLSGDLVLVVGRVRRRFFRTATGARGAKTEVEADTVARARDRKRLVAISRKIGTALGELEEID